MKYRLLHWYVPSKLACCPCHHRYGLLLCICEHIQGNSITLHNSQDREDGKGVGGWGEDVARFLATKHAEGPFFFAAALTFFKRLNTIASCVETKYEDLEAGRTISR